MYKTQIHMTINTDIVRIAELDFNDQNVITFIVHKIKWESQTLQNHQFIFIGMCRP